MESTIKTIKTMSHGFQFCAYNLFLCIIFVEKETVGRKFFQLYMPKARPIDAIFQL